MPIVLLFHRAAQVAEVLAVAAVPDDGAAQIDAFLGEDRLLHLARPADRQVVRRDRHAGRLLGSGGGAQDVVDHRVTPAVSVAHLMMEAHAAVGDAL